MAIVSILVLLAVIWGVAYAQVSHWLWTAIVGTVLLVLTFDGSLNIIFLSICWFFFLVAALFANLKTLRQRFFTKPFIQVLQKRMPTISRTEREAIEAGNVWWEKELFCGRPQWKNLLAIPEPKLTSEEQDFIDNQVETVCGMLDDWQIVYREHDLPKTVWDYYKKERFLGMIIPKEYGGHGFSALAHSTIVTKIATRSGSAAVDAMVPNSLGPAELLLHYGTKEQKDYYLPRLAKGEEIPCFALTGPEAGSDAGGITDAGIVCHGEYQGKQVLGIRLSWDKRYITLAPIATLLGLAFRLFDPDHLLGKKEDIGITLCLIPTAHSGVEIGHRHFPMFLAFMNGPTRGKDVFIPIEWIVGGVAMAGQGWKMLMESLSVGRSISLPALSTAFGKMSYRATGAYARVRRQFNTAISNFEGVEEALGYIAGYTYILEACRIMTAGAVDLKIKPSIVSAIAKYHMTELARKVLGHAMDVHAGHAIQAGPRNIFAQAHVAIPICITVEGANILTRNLIIFGQGAIRCHPYVLEEIGLLAATPSADQVKKLDKLLLSHVGYVISNFARVFWDGLTGGRFLSSPVKGPTAYYYRQLTRMSAALALLSDVCMIFLGGNLKRKERISARLGDLLSWLYLASTVLKYYQDNKQPDVDLCYVKWCVQQCLCNIQMTCDELLDNFPVPFLGKFLHVLIFPFGKAYRKPSDHLHHKITKVMLEPSVFRDRLTKDMYMPKEEHEPVRQVETALIQALQVDPIIKKLQSAIKSGAIARRGNMEERRQAALKAGILTAEEVQALHDFDAIYKEVIKVNEFSFDLNSVIS